MNVLGLSRTTVYYLMRADDFPVITIGNRRLVRKEKLIKWLDAHENNNAEALRHPQPFRRGTKGTKSPHKRRDCTNHGKLARPQNGPYGDDNAVCWFT